MSKILIFLGNSGSGKSFAESQLLSNYSDRFKKVISATTRAPRNNEKHGADYYFLSQDEFKNQIFAEQDSFGGNNYGTLASEINTERDIILVIEPNGAKKILDFLNKNNINKEVIIFLFDIDQEIRIKNMEKRGDSRAQIEKRLLSDDILARIKNNNLKVDYIFNKNLENVAEDIMRLIETR